MEIKRTIINEVLTTDGYALKENDAVIYSLADGTCHAGYFKGINKRNNLLFTSVLEDKEVSVMPKTIAKIFKANINVIEREVV